MYLINHVDPFSPAHTAMNCLTPARDRVADPVPKSLPPLLAFLAQPICNPILCSCFVFLLFFFFVVFRSSCCHSFFCCFSGFKPLSNASSFLLASPVDGPLISHSLWGFPLCSHIFITAYRCQPKDWLALEGVKSSPVGNCQKYRCTYQHWSLLISLSFSKQHLSPDQCLAEKITWLVVKEETLMLYLFT